MSISIPNNVPEDMVSEMVADVEAVCDDRLCELGDTTDLEGGISSTIGDEICDWGSSSVRSTILPMRVIFCFLAPMGGFVAFEQQGFHIVGLDWEWGPTARTVATIGEVTTGSC